MNDPQSPVQRAWDAYQASAARNPYSDETRRLAAAYKRALTIARRKRGGNRGEVYE